ncbi:MAG TPA: cysteine synthase family protein [Alphaproteobacteria bacterium]|nr:cysteine synthase family protein [Alphaproteobacteria bacterium]
MGKAAITDPMMDTMVGNTPLVPLNRLFTNTKGIQVFAKLELMNPSGSVKDRIVVHILKDAEARGLLKPGGTVVEATSGNTGASLAYFCARRGYRLILTTLAKVSEEKKNHMRLLGAELIVCPTEAAHGSPEHYTARAQQIAADIPGAFLVNQYDNPLNTEAHYLTTGPEIWQQMNGRIDWFVTAGSTGGTVSGAARYLKEQDKNIRVLLPDPVGSIYYHYVKTGEVNEKLAGSYQVEGVGEDHLTKNFDSSFVDDAVQYTDDDAFRMCQACARTEGILPGLSAGGNLAGVKWLINQLEQPARIVTIIQDSGVKYLSKLLTKV